MNLAELPRQEIERFGEHVSVIYQGREYTNVQMRERALRLANALCDLGVQKGDRVIVQMPNCPEALNSFQAVYALGAVVAPINYMVGDDETAYIYKDTGANTIISNMLFYDKIQKCSREAPDIKNLILTDEEVPEGALSFNELVQAQPADFKVVSVVGDDLAALIYTAGTTGMPKGVMHTHHSLYINAKYQYDTVGLEPGLTSISVLPLCHSYGIASMNLGYLLGGGKVVLEEVDIEKIFASIEKYKASTMAAVPTLYVYMLLHPDPQKYDLSSMKYWFCGSAPLTRDTWEQFKAKFGYEITEGWGLTEAGANNSANPIDGLKKVGSIGKPMHGTHVKIVNEQGEEMPDGEEGEILLSGPMIMKGYWNKPAETAEAIKDGWLYTGDIGYRDSDGYFYITERKKDLIIKGGENIAPREVEEAIHTHPKVSEAAVIGVPDPTYGEEIKAFVVLTPGQEVSAEEIIDHCTERIKRFKSPKQVEFLDALPKSLVGKVLRKELRRREPDVT